MGRGWLTGQTHSSAITKVLFAWFCKNKLLTHLLVLREETVNSTLPGLCLPGVFLGVSPLSVTLAGSRRHGHPSHAASWHFTGIWIALGLWCSWEEPFHPWASSVRLDGKVLNGGKVTNTTRKLSCFTRKETEVQKVKGTCLTHREKWGHRSRTRFFHSKF